MKLLLALTLLIVLINSVIAMPFNLVPRKPRAVKSTHVQCPTCNNTDCKTTKSNVLSHKSRSFKIPLKV